MEPGQNITTELWSMDEAAKYLGKTTAALRNGYKRWGIPIVKFGGQKKFTKELLDEYIARNTVQPEPQQPKPARKPPVRNPAQPTA